MTASHCNLAETSPKHFGKRCDQVTLRQVNVRHVRERGSGCWFSEEKKPVDVHDWRVPVQEKEENTIISTEPLLERCRKKKSNLNTRHPLKGRLPTPKSRAGRARFQFGKPKPFFPRGGPTDAAAE
ncbi:hypothetical protein NPIL_515041 [Nephila pilipes]|uniref:Uncharacterized protein n=1 Tax=Nephila pilipes TaxID=299642 RepID=A0A8X6P6B5_NEPPI|nr:hypothetical protein NPIL_515041 [Nephila pilipes]